MKPSILIPCVASVMVVVAAVASAAGQPGPPSARGLKFLEPAFFDATAKSLESGPKRFEITLKREMPTPGWKLSVDGVEVDEKGGRIVVHVTETPPGGMVAQVITATPLTILLEPLIPRVYTLEVRLRRGPAGTYSPVHAMVLSAF